MIPKNHCELYCFRTQIRDQRIIKGKGTQISPELEDASFSPPPYDVRTNGTLANVGTCNSHKAAICRCRTKTWRSIKDLYKNQDTTVVWDDRGPLNNTIDNNALPVVMYDTVNEKRKKGRLGLSKTKGTYKVNSNKNLKLHLNSKDVKKIKYFKENKNVNKEVQNSGNVKQCKQGICQAKIEEGKKHRCKCKTVKERKVKERRPKITQCTNTSCNLEDVNRMDAGDYPLKNKQKKGFFSCFSKICNKATPQPIPTKKEPTKPSFAIRVDSSNLQVLNANEIKTKVKVLGKVGKRDKCICPSRLERAKKYGIGDTCEGGVCETARKGKYDLFNCNCAKTAVIECCDRTCDNRPGLDLKTTEHNAKPTDTNTPVFEMVLDNNHMNVLNTGEIYDVLKKASYSDMCPSGVCRDTANIDRILNCKCVSKKISPILHECHKGTCQPEIKTKKKPKYVICTKICSSLGNWSCRKKQRGDGDANVDINTRQKDYSNLNDRPKPKRSKFCFICTRICSSLGNWSNKNTKDDSDNRPGKTTYSLQPRKMYPATKDRKHGKDANKKPEIKKGKAKKVKLRVITNTTKSSIWKFRSKPSGALKRDVMSKKIREREKNITKDSIKKEKELKKKDKQKLKEQMRRKKEIARLQMSESRRENFLTGLLIGIINLTLQSLKGVITMFISVITDPIHSYIYTKHRVKDPVGSLKLFKNWLVNTWQARDSNISTKLNDSHVLHVLSDEFEESAVYQMFANKGQTPEERQIYERKSKRRKKRIRRRHQKAVYSCRHMLLITLRKHPWLWVYHLCPNFYPQCLSLLGFISNFGHLLLYLAALLCWTPCILCMEVVRAFLCCVLCTQ